MLTDVLMGVGFFIVSVGVFAVIRSGRGDASQRRYSASLCGILGFAITLFSLRIFVADSPAWLLIAVATMITVSAIGLISTTTPSWRNLAVDDLLAATSVCLVVYASTSWLLHSAPSAAGAVDLAVLALLVWMALMVSRMARLRWSFAKVESIVLVSYLTMACICYSFISLSALTGKSLYWSMGTKGMLVCSTLVSIHMVMRARSQYTTPRRDTGKPRPSLLQYIVLAVAATVVIVGTATAPEHVGSSVNIGLLVVAVIGVMARTMFSLVGFEKLIEGAGAQERYYRDLVQHSTDVIVVVNPRTRLAEYVSPSAERILGYSPDYLVGKNVAYLIGAADDDLGFSLTDLVDQGASKRCETIVSGRHIESMFTPHEQKVLVIVRDVTECSTLRDELHRMAYEDGLTKIANRHSILQTIDEKLQHDPSRVALLFIDLDKFKPINDKHGHEVGDMILVEVARRLQKGAESHEVVGRLGGDEFVVVSDPTQSNPVGRGFFMRSLLQAQFDVAETSFFIGGSVGVALGEGTRNALDLLRQSDSAMYTAKRGNNPVVQFDETMMRSFVDSGDTMAEVAQALRSDDLAVVFQPIVDVTSEEVMGYESFIRWRTESGELHDADLLLAYAAQSGQLPKITAWVTEQAYAQGQILPVTGKIGLNISSSEVLQADFMPMFNELLHTLQISPDRVSVDVPANQELAEAIAKHDVIRQLRKSGIDVVLDDFGVGYANMLTLLEQPITGVKVAPELVTPLPETPIARSVLKNIVQVAHTNGIFVIAEGVENRREHHWVKVLGCDYGQGFFYGRPQLAPDATDTAHPGSSLAPEASAGS